MTLPGVTQLTSTPDILRNLLLGLTAEQTQWKPNLDRFSVAEVLEHLSHTEGHFYRLTIEKLVTEEHPQISGYDQNAAYAAGVYSGRDAEDSFDHWEEQREDNIAYLNCLSLQAADRRGDHSEVGEVTLGQILNEWAFHDLGHIRQIAELVRTIRYYPELGRMQSQYEVKP